MIKILFILPLLIISLLFTGCWDLIELDNLDIVLAVAADQKSEEKIELTLETAKTVTGEAGSMEKRILTTATGDSFFDAARNVTLSLPRVNYWPHTQVVVVGEELGRNSINNLVDFFVRDTKRRITVNFVTCEGKGRELLVQKPSTEIFLAFEMLKIVKQVEKTGFGVESVLRNILKETQGVTGVTLINKMVVREKEDETKAEATKIMLDGTGVFYQYQLIDYLNSYETRAVNMLRDNYQTGVIIIPYGDDGQELTFEVSSAKTRVIPQITEEGYIAAVQVEIEANIVEYSENTNLNDIAIEKMNDLFSAKIYRQIEQTFTKAQDIRADVFLLGDSFANRYSEVSELSSEEWREIFSNQLILELSVEVKVNFTGTSFGETGRGSV